MTSSHEPVRAGSDVPVVSFIIPVRNDAVGLERCLKSIAVATAGRSSEVIVIDNASIDGSGDRAVTLGATVFRLDGRVARLRNFAANVARGELLAFVDADHEIDGQWVAAAVDLLADQSIVAAGAAYHPPAFGNWVQRSYNLLRDHRPGIHDAAWLASGNLVVRRGHFQAVGGFDETLETCEDVDLCQRLTRSGCRVVSDSRLRSTHYGDPSTLRRLFASELWRGRDNIRVSLRKPALREMPSVIIPVVDVLAAVTALVALIGFGRQGVLVALPALAIIVAFTSIRARKMTSRAGARRMLTVAQIWCVALVYDLGRAMALIFRTPHRRLAGPVRNE
jgi:GT2 family glycosyltransferase